MRSHSLWKDEPEDAGYVTCDASNNILLPQIQNASGNVLGSRNPAALYERR